MIASHPKKKKNQIPQKYFLTLFTLLFKVVS